MKCLRVLKKKYAFCLLCGHSSDLQFCIFLFAIYLNSIINEQAILHLRKRGSCLDRLILDIHTKKIMWEGRGVGMDEGLTGKTLQLSQLHHT